MTGVPGQRWARYFCLISVQPVDGAVVGHAHQQGAALPAVHERGDRLQRGALQQPDRLAGVLMGAQRGLVLQKRRLAVGPQQFEP